MAGERERKEERGRVRACLPQLHQVGEHDDCGRVLLPHHVPKVDHGLLQGPLRGDVLTSPLVAL